MGFQRITAGVLLAAFTASPGYAAAPESQTPAKIATSIDAQTAEYATKIYLAYIRGSDPQANIVAQKGLEALAERVGAKTLIKPAGVVGLDIEKDDLTLFPFIYWIISDNTPTLSEKAQEKLQHYLLSDKMVFFDLRNKGEPIGSRKILDRVLGKVSLRHLDPIPKDHLLTKTFYRVSSLRGTFDYKTVRVERPDTEGGEISSSVIVGENNWAAAWAAISLPDNSPERELSLQVGVNVLIYTLTAEYKADQENIIKLIDKLDNK